jgi:2-oxoglutarate ferredoxin oxidoreductase subunit beta
MGLQDKSIGIAPVGCPSWPTNISTLTGRKLHMGVLRHWRRQLNDFAPTNSFSPIRAIGDLAAIGTGETIHAANRGENIAIIFINTAFMG